MTTQTTAPQCMSNLRHQYLTGHRILGMIVAGVGLSLSLSGSPAWGQFCSVPSPFWCSALQSRDCLATVANETCLPREIVFPSPTAPPMILLCDCFTNFPDCGPVDIQPNPIPPGGYTVSCPGPCPPGQVCELHFNGVSQWVSSIDSSQIPAGAIVSCGCEVPPPPPVCPVGNSWCVGLQSTDCNTTTTNEICLPREVTIDPLTGLPIILLCDCFTTVLGCGPVDVQPNPTIGYTVSCPGPCPALQTCQVHFNGTPTGMSSVDTSTMLPPYPVMTCACALPPPTLCPLPAGAECAALQSRDCQSAAGECLPKAMRHHIPAVVAFFPPAATDVLRSTTGYVAIQTPPPNPIIEYYYIRESPPNRTQVIRESPTDVGGHRIITTEIMAMELVGVAGGGGGGGAVQIRESPTLSSKGRVTGAVSGVTDYPADSFFDLFVEIDIPGLGVTGLYNDELTPIPLDAPGIRAVPPLGSSFKTPQGWPGVELLDALGNPTGFVIREVVHELPPPDPPEWEVIKCACMDPTACHATRDVSVDPTCIGTCPPWHDCVQHITVIDPTTVDYSCECVPQPEACCFVDGHCEMLRAADCLLIDGTPKGLGTSCLGDHSGNGIDDACEILDKVVCEPQGVLNNPFHPPTYWYDVTPTGFGRCDFHVRVYDPNPGDYTNWGISPYPWPVASWKFAVQQVGLEWWASWWDSDPNCSHAFFVKTRFQFDNPNASTWGDWSTTISNSSDPYNQVVDRSANHPAEPDGSGYRVHVPTPPVQACCLQNGTCVEVEYNRCVTLGGDPQGLGVICDMLYCPALKWVQPPTYGPFISPKPPCFWGWDDLSDYFSGPIVADDWACDTNQPITDIHWWGSYQNWTTREAPPPGMGPVQFHIGIWTDVPRNVDRPFSHPNKLIWQWIVPREATAERWVGCDEYPGQPPDTCFRYDFNIPEAEWFYQAPVSNPTIYWISISAVNLGPQQQYPWGWKTREHFFNDDAVRIFAPTAPVPGAPFIDGVPIETPDGVSWDMAFVLTTSSPGPSKWDQWPDVSLPGLHAHDGITLADNWECTGGVVTDLHWWGNYELDDQGREKRGAGIQCINLSIHANNPTSPWCLPQDPALWGVCALFRAINEHDTGLVNSEGSKIYEYTFYLNPGWPQTPGDIYWLDIEVQSNNPANPAMWRWQENGRKAVPRLCPAAERTPPPPPFMWQSIDWPLEDPLLYSEMAFRITSAPHPPPGNIVWDPDPLSADRTTRSLRFRVEGKPNGSLADAIRVELVELGHPDPRNAVATVALPFQTVPQNFSKFDTNSNGVCSGAMATPNYNGHPCDPLKVPSNADCLCNTQSCAFNDAAHNGICIGNPAPPLVTCTATNESVPPDVSGQGGCARWVGKPATFLEAQQVPGLGNYRLARLQCTPFYYDWVTETAGKVCAGPLGPTNSGLPCVDDSNCTAPATCVPKKITVVGAEILPSSTYSVQTYGASCKGNEGNCKNVSTLVTMLTRRHGDVASVFTPPDVGQPSSIDVSRIVDAFGKKGPLRKAGAKITPNLPEENLDIGADDIGRVVDAAKGFAYPLIESGPCPCPPVHPITGLLLLCGATPCTCDAGPACAACGGACVGGPTPGANCTSNSQCGTGGTCSGAGQCVKTCTGGVNDGLACRDNDPVHNHCPGGICGSGFCRDKCARCTPP